MLYHPCYLQLEHSFTHSTSISIIIIIIIIFSPFTSSHRISSHLKFISIIWILLDELGNRIGMPYPSMEDASKFSTGSFKADYLVSFYSVVLAEFSIRIWNIFFKVSQQGLFGSFLFSFLVFSYPLTFPLHFIYLHIVVWPVLFQGLFYKLYYLLVNSNIIAQLLLMSTIVLFY